MRHLMVAAGLALALLLSGCTSEDGEKFVEVVTQVQAKTAAICSFVPQAKVVIAIMTAGDPTLTGAAVAAEAICAAINRPMGLYDGLHGPGRPEVNGVPIDGAFVPTGEDNMGPADAGRLTGPGANTTTVPRTTYEELYELELPPVPPKNPLH